MMRDYTTNEACNAVGCARVTIYKAIDAGKLLSYKRGTTILIDKKELTRWDKLRKR